MSDAPKAGLDWTGVMLERDGVGVAYPIGNENEAEMREIAATVNSHGKLVTCRDALAGLVRYCYSEGLISSVPSQNDERIVDALAALKEAGVTI